MGLLHERITTRDDEQEMVETMQADIDNWQNISLALQRERHHVAELYAEIQILQQRLEELEEIVTEYQQRDALHEDVINQSTLGFFVKRIDGLYLLVNDKTASFLRHSTEQLIGHYDYELFPARTIERWRRNDQEVIEEGKTVQFETVMHHEEGLRTYLTTRFPIHAPDGSVYAMGGISIDITERNKTEAARAVWELQINDARQQVLQELATPLLPLSKEVLLMPLIGDIDKVRAKQIEEVLLKGVAEHHAVIALIDITGMKDVDGNVLARLLQMAKAVKLLGTEVIITGIQPAIAQTIAKLNLSMQGIMTFATLQRGIGYAIQRTGNQ
jgi:rsbT co-antagonist protein RsbR